jgi:hypothetical protein
MVQPCSMTMWPTVTRSPTTNGWPVSACSTLASWMLLPAPTVMLSASPRSTAPHHTLACAPSVTRPITCALSATQAESASCGTMPSSSYTAMFMSPNHQRSPP